MVADPFQQQNVFGEFLPEFGLESRESKLANSEIKSAFKVHSILIHDKS